MANMVPSTPIAPPGASSAVVSAALQRFGQAPAIGNTEKVKTDNDGDLLKYFKARKDEAFADRWIFERQWTKIIHYINNRQWLAPYSRTEGWKDARLGKGIPRPVTNKAREADQAIRAMFTAIKFGVVVRPVSQNTKSILAASVADDMAPLLHSLHDMDQVMNEFDFWFVNNGNAILHTWWDVDAAYGQVRDPYEECAACKLQMTSSAIAQTKQRCPACGGTDFTPAMNPDGSPRDPVMHNQGGAVTSPLSLLEVAFPLTHPRWSEVPFLIRMRWRDKAYYEGIPELWDQVKDSVKWQKSSTERSLQIFQSLPFQNDQPNSRGAGLTGETASQESEGIAEYELWQRPCGAYPDGFVMRVVGDTSPLVLHSEESEGLPGAIPYHDVKGNPLFTFSHGHYSHVGGRVIGSGAHDPVMAKYDAVNRMDSLIEMIAMRCAAPQWMLPKGSDVKWLGDSPGLPGLLLQWNPTMAGPNGRPERVSGSPLDQGLIELRKMLLNDIEEGLGTYDILRGAKPAGVEAFSALQLLVERGQQRFANAFMSRGRVYRDWFRYALELEREHGPDTRIMAVMSPTKSYAFQVFKNADLGGEVDITIEDGTYTPKTSLGERASIEHLKQLGLLEPGDQEQKWSIFQKFGQTALAPSMNAQVQSALKKQEDFERWWATSPAAKLQPGPTLDPQQHLAMLLGDPQYPLRWRRWYDPAIHRQEFLKWANSETVQQMVAQSPAAEAVLNYHLREIDNAITEKMMGAIDPGGNADMPQPGAAPGGPAGPGGPSGPGGQPPQTGAGAGMAMANSNRNAGGAPPLPGGPPQGAQPPA